MSQVNNIGAIDLTPRDNGAQQFNNMYTQALAVPADQHDGIQTFFEILTKNKTSAKVLTSSVIYTAISQNINPMDLIFEFQRMTIEEVNAYLVTFLNLNRVPTSLLGVITKPPVNQFVERTIRV
jgi:hypothetical protein